MNQRLDKSEPERSPTRIWVLTEGPEGYPLQSPRGRDKGEPDQIGASNSLDRHKKSRRDSYGTLADTPSEAIVGISHPTMSRASGTQESTHETIIEPC
ncbi:hypothetical protein L204_101382 [Cryptococcus depauperatus]